MHSKRHEGAKCSHCLQGWTSNPDFGHCQAGSERFCSSEPYSAILETARVPGMFIGRGPKVFSLFGCAAGFSNSFFGPPPESWYPRWRYLRSDKKCLLAERSFSAFGAPGTRDSLADGKACGETGVVRPRPPWTGKDARRSTGPGCFWAVNCLSDFRVLPSDRHGNW